MKLGNFMLGHLSEVWGQKRQKRARVDSVGVIAMLALDANAGLEPIRDGKYFVQLDAGHRPWGIPLAELKAIEGEWLALPDSEINPLQPDWSVLGLDAEQSFANSPGVNYVGDRHMVVIGDNGDTLVFWALEKV